MILHPLPLFILVILLTYQEAKHNNDDKFVTLHHFPNTNTIREGIEQNTVGNPTITARSTRLLVVAFNRFWQAVVDHKPYIWLVNPHSKGDSCANHLKDKKHDLSISLDLKVNGSFKILQYLFRKFKSSLNFSSNKPNAITKEKINRSFKINETIKSDPTAIDYSFTVH